MKNLIFLLVIIISGLFQVTILNCIKVFGVKPDLLLCCAVLAGVFFKRSWAFAFSLFAGTIKDIFGQETFGLNVMLFFLWNYLVVELSKKISIEDSPVLGVVMFIVVFCNDIASRFIFLFLGRHIFFGIFLKVTLVESVYTALALLLLLKIFEYFNFFPVYKNAPAKKWIDEAESF